MKTFSCGIAAVVLAAVAPHGSFLADEQPSSGAISDGRAVAFSRQRAVRPRENYEPQIREHVLAIANHALETYRNADFSLMWQEMDVRRTENALYAVIPVSQAMAWIVRYENGSREIDSMTKAIDLLEFSTDLHDSWGLTWASPSVVNAHLLMAHRIRQHRDLPPDIESRAELLWQKSLSMLEIEANAQLSVPLPTPWDSSTTLDSKAEELAWGASLFTAAAVFLPDHPNAPLWERRARQLAYNAITRPSDPPDLEGVKMTTVTEDFCLSNHDIRCNPYYVAATLQLLQQAELPYLVTRQPSPDELDHNFMELYRVYRTYTSFTPDGSDAYWSRFADPGDPTLFPIAKAGDLAYDVALAGIRAQKKRLWDDAAVTAGVIPHDAFYSTVQNHKVIWYQVVGLYLYTMPEVRTWRPENGPRASQVDH